MGYAGYDGEDGEDGADQVPASLKILVSGGFGAGKSTLVAAVSEIRSLHTEEMISDRSEGIDSLRGVAAKASTTVALDFGRLSIDGDIMLYLFGTPGQERFWFMWEELALGAVGAVVLADTRRLADCFPCLDFFEQRGIPFVVAVNCFDGARRFPAASIRDALDLDAGLPVLLCDARLRWSCRDVLVALVEHAAGLIQAGRFRNS